MPPPGSLPIIYRLFAEDDSLLYVGRTTNLHQRLREHRGKHWWSAVARGTFEFASNAVSDEWIAITTERPLMNGTTGAVPVDIPAGATPAERQRAMTRDRVRRYRQRQRELREAAALPQDGTETGQAVTGSTPAPQSEEDEMLAELTEEGRWGEYRETYGDDAA